MNIEIMSRKEKVLIVHNYYQIPGGEDTVVANETALLQSHGHEVVTYFRNNAELQTASGMKKLGLLLGTVFSTRTYREVKKLIREQKVDVVHVHNTLNLISPSVYYAARSCGVPVVQTIHNFRLLCPGATFFRDGRICEDCVSKGLGCAVKHSCYRGSKLQTLACVITARVHRAAGIYGKIHYICLTEFNKEKLLSMKQIKVQQIDVKPNFVERAEMIVPYTERKDQYIFAGRLDKLKGIEYLLQAWEKMGSSAPKLIVYGTGPLEEWCREFAAKHNDLPIELRGFEKNEIVREEIAVSKALILPTQWYEGFPMSILEAYSVGTPVIGSDFGNVGSLIEEGRNGWKIDSKSPDSIAAAVRAGKEADTEWIAGQYSAEANYEQLVSIYRGVTGTR